MVPTSRARGFAEAMALTLAAEAELVAAAVTVAKSAPEPVVEFVAAVALAAVVAQPGPVAVATLAAVPVAKCPPCLRLSVVPLDQCFAAVLPSLDSSR